MTVRGRCPGRSGRASPSSRSTAGASPSPPSTSGSPSGGSAGPTSRTSTCCPRSAASGSRRRTAASTCSGWARAAARHRATLAELPAAAHRDAGRDRRGCSCRTSRRARRVVRRRRSSTAGRRPRPTSATRGIRSSAACCASRRSPPRTSRCASAPAVATAPRWLALAPERPGAPESHRAWFLVALPGNLVALELVSEGAHATYCFRTVPRAAFAGGAGPDGIDRCGCRRAGGDGSRPRSSTPASSASRSPSPTTSWRRRRGSATGWPCARSRRSPPRAPTSSPGWSTATRRAGRAALDDLIAWHAACRDDAAAWPGRAAQEAQVAEASGAGAPTG